MVETGWNLDGECRENVEDEDGTSEAEGGVDQVTAVILALPSTPELPGVRVGEIFAFSKSIHGQFPHRHCDDGVKPAKYLFGTSVTLSKETCRACGS